MSLVYTFRFFAKWYTRFVEARTRGLLIFFGGEKRKKKIKKMELIYGNIEFLEPLFLENH
jgi:hypothetical protein